MILHWAGVAISKRKGACSVGATNGRMADREKKAAFPVMGWIGGRADGRPRWTMRSPARVRESLAAANVSLLGRRRGAARVGGFVHVGIE